MSLVFPSPTASKVANIGERKPDSAPPMMLAPMPTTGHKIKKTGMHMQVRSFRTGPNCLALLVREI